ncbi:MAG: hypothetical protein IJP48_02145 [Synergistaceae bacterium]|nr:hypothetical protein [Synergistaceae bacterium]
MKADKILKIYKQLSEDVNKLTFSVPVVSVYNPLSYAWHGFEKYISFMSDDVKYIFLGMNPGPWGMAQTGVPFGEVDAVKNFLGINDLSIRKPLNELNEYPVKGLECTRSEVSGKRLWGLFKQRYDDSSKFFRENFVLNYCPLLFLSGRPGGHARNFTPDKLNMIERRKLFTLCDNCLRHVIEIIKPEVLIGVGVFAASKAEDVLKGFDIRIIKILHPSPASPKSNNDWAGKVTRQLIEFGVWQ